MLCDLRKRYSAVFARFEISAAMRADNGDRNVYESHQQTTEYPRSDRVRRDRSGFFDSEP